MTDADLSPPRPAIPASIRASQAVVAIMLLVKVYAAIATPPIGDEAYYWIWGQKLAWSYLDHPPLHAWLLRLMDVIFGWNLFSLRALTWFTLAGCLGILWYWSRKLRPDNPQAWFWPTAMIYLSSPVFFVMGGIVFNDHLLIFLCLAAGSAFLVFAEKWEASGRGFAWLYAAAILLGLAVLTKYNGVLVGIGAALFFAWRRPLRPLWRSPHLYLAALLSVAIQAPVFWWNLTEGFASYQFHLSERWGGALFRFRPIFLAEYVVLTPLIISPFLYWPIVGMIRRGLGVPIADRARQLALLVLAVSTLLFAFLSIFVEIFFYWNVVGYVLLLPFIGGWIRHRWIIVAHVIYGSLVTALCLFHLTGAPIRDDWTIASSYGWPDVAQRVRAFEAEYGTDFVVGTRYTTTAQLAFAMQDPEVMNIARRHDQYDFWFDPATRIGQDAIIVTDATMLGLTGVRPYFDDIEQLETVTVTRMGRIIYQPSIYIGRNFHLPADENP